MATLVAAKVVLVVAATATAVQMEVALVADREEALAATAVGMAAAVTAEGNGRFARPAKAVEVLA